jgi:excinuclease UvrABC nuclease subunit
MQKHLLRGASLKLKAKTLHDLFHAGVYVIRNVREVLYVGSGGNVPKRVVHSNSKALDSMTILEFFPCANLKLARARENKLIARLRPKHNIHGNR